MRCVELVNKKQVGHSAETPQQNGNWFVKKLILSFISNSKLQLHHLVNYMLCTIVTKTNKTFYYIILVLTKYFYYVNRSFNVFVVSLVEKYGRKRSYTGRLRTLLLPESRSVVYDHIRYKMRCCIRCRFTVTRITAKLRLKIRLSVIIDHEINSS
jgi:hypothetical protein